MLQVTRHASAASFLGRAERWLMRAEAENNLILGFTAAWVRDPPAFKAPPYLATVELDDGVVACGFRAPPHKLALTRSAHANAQAILAADALALYPDLDTAFGPEPDVEGFAAAWADLAGRRVQRAMRARIHEARRVERPRNPPPGRLRPAAAADLELVLPWIASFFDEIREVHREDPARLASTRLKQQSLFVWDDRGPVSMAGWGGKTPNGARVNLVYTPPELRSRGYATACVAALTERLLAEGNGYCCLYTNLANPVSNRIYRRIGYRAICDVSDFGIVRE